MEANINIITRLKCVLISVLSIYTQPKWKKYAQNINDNN